MKDKLRKVSGFMTLRLCTACALLIAAVSLGRMATITNAQSQSGGQLWVVAFQNANGLPNNVDDIVAKAGGQITTRIPEIGGIAVTSNNPNFGANIVQNNTVKAADIATPMGLIEPAEPTTQSADNNGGNVSPTGSDTQPM